MCDKGHCDRPGLVVIHPTELFAEEVFKVASAAGKIHRRDEIISRIELCAECFVPWMAMTLNIWKTMGFFDDGTDIEVKEQRVYEGKRMRESEAPDDVLGIAISPNGFLGEIRDVEEDPRVMTPKFGPPKGGPWN